MNVDSGFAERTSALRELDRMTLQGKTALETLAVLMRPTDQWEEADMSDTNTIHSSEKEDGTDVPKPEGALSYDGALGDSAAVDRTRQNDIRLRAYEIHVQCGQQPHRAMDDWLRAKREWNRALVLQAFDTLFNLTFALRWFSRG